MSHPPTTHTNPHPHTHKLKENEGDTPSQFSRSGLICYCGKSIIAHSYDNGFRISFIRRLDYISLENRRS